MTMRWFAISLKIVFLIYSFQLFADSQFTYQGELTQTGTPANGQFDMEFALWNAAMGGAQQGSTVALPSVPVSDGKFTVQLDFGVPALGPADGMRWLEIRVEGVVLDPRQPLSPAPFAVQTRGIYTDEANNVGIGTTSPANLLHLRGSDATLRLDDATDANSYALIDDASSGQLVISKHASSGNVLIDINPQPEDPAEPATIRLFRETNTTGNKAVSFYRGNNTTQVSAVIGVDGGDSVFQLNGGNVGIGTLEPQSKLHVAAGSSGAPEITFLGVEFAFENDESATLMLASGGTNPATIKLGGAGPSGQITEIRGAAEPGMELRSGAATVKLDSTEGYVGINHGGGVPAYPVIVGYDSSNGNGAHLTVGGEWVNGSDRNSKEGFLPVDRHDILVRLVEMPITQWRFKGEEETVQHLGPVAQDFHAAFGLGDSDRYIGTLDATGVALAAIQGLYEMVSERDRALNRERGQFRKQAQQIDGLLTRLHEIETQLADTK